MPKSTKSARSSLPLKRKKSSGKTPTVKTTIKAAAKPIAAKSIPLGRRLVAGFKEALAHARRELDLSGYTVMVPDDVDVAKIRQALGLSQNASRGPSASMSRRTMPGNRSVGVRTGRRASCWR
jgi:hypothetical protein